MLLIVAALCAFAAAPLFATGVEEATTAAAATDNPWTDGQDLSGSTVNVFGAFVDVDAERFDASMDIYNLLNASNVFSVNGRYGPAWLTPQTSHFGSAIMDGRLFAFNGRFSF